MPFTITAVLPLGTYRGSASDGRPEPLPSVTRLHSALLAAAGFGPRAVLLGEDVGATLVPCPQDDAALRWLEDHPPHAVSVPALRINASAATAYRRDGTLESRKSGIGERSPLGKPVGGSVAVSGPLTWTWWETPPEPVAQALAALCPDVSHLGTTESPVQLRADHHDDPAVTHQLDADADLFRGGDRGLDLDVPVSGRLDELLAAHGTLTVRPSSAKDRVSGSERSSAPVPTRQFTAVARYTPTLAPDVDVPWPQVLLVPFDRRIDPIERVRWAVAVHRALIRLTPGPMPPLVTGTYREGSHRPVNRLAVHWIDPTLPLLSPPAAETRSLLALLLPAGASASDVDITTAALDRLTSVRGPGGRLARRLSPPVVARGEQLWAPPLPGSLRLWQTSPAAVPDTRGSRNSTWTFVQAALLSLGFTWKDQLPAIAARGDERDRALAAAVAQRGVAVLRTYPVREAVHCYVHRVHPDAIVRPYRALLWLGDLSGTQTAQAIGQSRHLGGGLLTPVDAVEGHPIEDVVRQWAKQP